MQYPQLFLDLQVIVGIELTYLSTARLVVDRECLAEMGVGSWERGDWETGRRGTGGHLHFPIPYSLFPKA